MSLFFQTYQTTPTRTTMPTIASQSIFSSYHTFSDGGIAGAPANKKPPKQEAAYSEDDLVRGLSSKCSGCFPNRIAAARRRSSPTLPGNGSPRESKPASLKMESALTSSSIFSSSSFVVIVSTVYIQGEGGYSGGMRSSPAVRRYSPGLPGECVLSLLGSGR